MVERATKPVKVTAILSTSVCGHVPMLESLLASHMLKHMPSVANTRNGHRHTSEDWNGYRNIPVPIAYREMGGWKIPCASSPIYRVEREEVANITRVPDFDLDAIRPSGANKINTTSGTFKGMRLPKRVLVIERVSWFALARRDGGGGRSSGVLSRLRQRLKKIDAIGAKTDIGYGRVSSWVVEEVGDDYSWFAADGGNLVLMRPLPACNEIPRNLVGWREWFDRPAPPYHDKKSACKVVVPC